MIKINLLPQAEKVKKTTQAPIIVFGMVIVVAIILFIVYMFQSSQIRSLQHQIASLEKQKAELKPKMEELQSQIEEKERKVQAINQLIGQERFLWSKKLNGLSDLVPNNVKFTHIYTVSKDNKTMLRIEGVSYSRSGEERVALIAKLMDALKDSKEFYNKLNGEPNFGEVQFVSTNNEKDKDTGWLIGNFVIEMQII